MASVSVSLACLTLIFLPVIFATTYLYEKLSSKIYRRLREYLSRINTKLNESLMGISIIQQFRQQNGSRMNLKMKTKHICRCVSR